MVSVFQQFEESFESVPLSFILDCLLKHFLISCFQLGFRPNSSTQEALLHLTNEWHQQLNSGHNVAAIFCDLSKAFDTVPHHLLLENLQCIGVSGSLLIWFEDYLPGQFQRVGLEGHTSVALPVTSVVYSWATPLHHFHELNL